MRTRSMAMLLALSLTATGALIVTTTAVASATVVHVQDDTTLRTALADANVTEIVFDGNITDTTCVGTYNRGNIGGDLTIDGEGFALSANGCNQTVLQLNTAGGQTDTLVHLTITGGNVSGVCLGSGGGVSAFGSAGTLVLDHSEVTGNGWASNGVATQSCGGSGAGVATTSSLLLISSTVRNNTLTCTLCDPILGMSFGAGIWGAGPITLIDSTVSDNTITGLGGRFGGGIYSNSTLSLAYSTIAGNSAPTGANVAGGPASASKINSFGSVVALPAGGGANCAMQNTNVTNGYNWDDGTSCGWTDSTDTQSTAANLAPLNTNGGATRTRAPNGGSGLIDKIPHAICGGANAADLASDQRDAVRPDKNGGSCDIGAVEVSTGGVSGTFTSIAPARILDTRDGTGGLTVFAPQATQDLTVDGAGSPPLPSSGIEAVVLNVTAVSPSAGGWLTLFPTGGQLPTASSVNFAAGQTVSTLVTVKIGNAGQVSINNTGGNPGAGFVHVVADVVGYYSDSTSVQPAKFEGLTPNRILDTRTSTGLAGVFAPQQTRSLTVTGGSVPGTADSVVMNVTAVNPSAAGWLTLFPTGTSAPTASSLNFAAGQTVANLVVVKVGTAGQVDIANTKGSASAGTVDVVGDVVGYFDSTAAGKLVATVPQRVLDTRTSLGVAGGSHAPLAAHGTIVVRARNALNLPSPGDFSAVIVHITAVTPTAAGWLTAYPSDATLPSAASLNFAAGATVANLLQVKVGPDGTFLIDNTNVPSGSQAGAGTVHVVVDIVGWLR